MKTLTIVTPFWNHPELIPEYIRVIDRSGAVEVIVVDNGSEPPIKLSSSITIIRNITNRGFSRACNQGLWAAKSDIVLFLNNDIRPTSNRPWGNELIDAVEPHVLVGMNIVKGSHTQVDGIAVPYIDGWCLAGMKDDLIALGGWDESYAEPSYYGDNDLCARASNEGYELKEVDLPIYHLYNQTAKVFDLHEVTPANYAKYAARIREMRKVKK